MTHTLCGACYSKRMSNPSYPKPQKDRHTLQVVQHNFPCQKGVHLIPHLQTVVSCRSSLAKKSHFKVLSGEIGVCSCIANSCQPIKPILKIVVLSCWTKLVKKQPVSTQRNIMPNPTILVTGFGPFGDHKTNASLEAVLKLPSIWTNREVKDSNCYAGQNIQHSKTQYFPEHLLSII